MEHFEQFIIQHQTTFSVLGKIFGAMLGIGLFIKFIYNFTVRYFENQSRDVMRINKFLWGPDGEPEKGLEHRLTDLERSHKDRTESGKSCRKIKK